MADIKKICMLTSGGDCGGLNAAIYGAAKIALANGVEFGIIPNGYAGLYNLDVINPVYMDIPRIENIHTAVAGSVAGHSRVKISKIKDDNKYARIQANLKKHNIDALIIAGGDDTGSVALDLIEHGIRCIHVPKTMDLDLQPYSVGGDSTIQRIAKLVNDLHTTGETHNRIIIFEVFGRYAGHTAFRGGIGADADCILLPEIGVNFDVVYEHFKRTFTARLERSETNSATYTMVVAEGMRNDKGEHFTDKSSGIDSFGHFRLNGVGAYMRQELQRLSKNDAQYWKDIFYRNGVFVENINALPEIRDILPTHIVRCGESSPYDISYGKQCGGGAVLALLNGITGVTMAGMQNGEFRYLPVKEAIVQRFVNLKDVEFYEQIGVCFGRNLSNYNPSFKQVEGQIERYM